VGFRALANNTIADDNTAVGFQALAQNTTGEANTAIGLDALANNTEGVQNTGVGVAALTSNQSGEGNTALGANALAANTTTNGESGSLNTAAGANALTQNTLGDSNIALGNEAGSELTTGSFNIYIGTGSAATESNTIRIDTDNQSRTFISGIVNVTAATAAIPVLVSTQGQLGTTSSSRRFKDAIKPMDKASEAILALKPVTFHYKSDRTSTPQFGLIAEEVAEVNPDLIVRDDKGDIYSVRYEAVNAMLLNEFLKEHRKNEEQQAIIERQQKQIEALTAGLQKVSAQLN
jgi:endosialidase-like protein